MLLEFDGSYCEHFFPAMDVGCLLICLVARISSALIANASRFFA
jgi:hypothetical protein